MIIKESEQCIIKHVFIKTVEKKHYTTVTSPAMLHCGVDVTLCCFTTIITFFYL